MASGFLGGLNATTLAKRRATRWLYLAGAHRNAPGSYTYEIARAKFIDEIVLAEAAAGLQELVLLGAGLDSRPYRLADRLEGVRVIEVDHPDSQESKRARLQRLLGHEPENVTYLGIDFTRDDLSAELTRVGHDTSTKALFVWSGVSPYLPEDAVAETLSFVGGHRGTGTSIVFDAVWREAIDGSRDYYGGIELLRAVERLGEPLRWGIPEGQVKETLAPFGLRVERALGADEWRAAYLRRSDGTLHDLSYGFGVFVHAETE